MARSAGLANGLNEVVAHRSQTAVQGRFWLQGLDPLGFAIYYAVIYCRVASCSIVNRSTYQTQQTKTQFWQQQQRGGTLEVLDTVKGPRAIGTRSQRLQRIEARAQRVSDAWAKSSSRKHAARSKGRKEAAAAARRCAKRPV